MSYILCILVNKLENGLKLYIKNSIQKNFHDHLKKNYKAESVTK